MYVCVSVSTPTWRQNHRGPPGVTGSCLLPYMDAHQTWALWERSTLNHCAISPAPSQPFKTDLMYQLKGVEFSPLSVGKVEERGHPSPLPYWTLSAWHPHWLLLSSVARREGSGSLHTFRLWRPISRLPSYQGRAFILPHWFLKLII